MIFFLFPVFYVAFYLLLRRDTNFVDLMGVRQVNVVEFQSLKFLKTLHVVTEINKAHTGSRQDHITRKYAAVIFLGQTKWKMVRRVSRSLNHAELNPIFHLKGHALLGQIVDNEGVSFENLFVAFEVSPLKYLGGW